MNISLVVDDSSDDEQVQIIPRVFKDRTSPFETHSDVEFRKDFRLTRPTFYKLCGLLTNDLKHPTLRSASLSVAQQVAACLNLLGRNGMQSDTARLTGCNQSTVSRLLGNFLEAMVNISGNFISWPSEAEQLQIARRVYRSYNLPNIVGFIDGSHIRIIAPSEHEEDYVNRKGYHSLNIGAICDDNRLFRWIDTQWPGSAHDSRVFKNSTLYSGLVDGTVKGCVIGDSAYSGETFLIKIVDNPQTEKEVRYNKAVCAVRSRIENAFGCLKRQWHILHGECRYDVKTTSKIVVACVVLRNIAISSKEPDFEENDSDLDISSIEMDEDCVNDGSRYSAGVGGKALVRRIIDEFF